jgi:hypothetical protein
MVCPVSVQEWLRRWRCGSLPSSGHPRADSRVQLTGGRMEHIDGRGGASPPRTSHNAGDGAAVPGMAP